MGQPRLTMNSVVFDTADQPVISHFTTVDDLFGSVSVRSGQLCQHPADVFAVRFQVEATQVAAVRDGGQRGSPARWELRRGRPQGRSLLRPALMGHLPTAPRADGLDSFGDDLVRLETWASACGRSVWAVLNNVGRSRRSR